MLIILVSILAFVILDIAALRWGKDSTERLESEEWEHRQHQALG